MRFSRFTVRGWGLYGILQLGEGLVYKEDASLGVHVGGKRRARPILWIGLRNRPGPLLRPVGRL